VAVAQAHKFAGLDTPTAAAAVRETMRGIRRTLGVSQTQKTPLMSDSLRAIGQLLPDDLMGARDRALLFVGFGGAFRRAELVALDADNVCFTDDGLVITLEKSKTDQESHGRTVGIPFGSFPLTCPVRALKNWLKLSGIKEGPLFRSIGRWDQVGSSRLSDKMVANIVKKRVAAIGFDPTRFAGHSLRSGFASSAAKAGRSERSIMRQTGHRSTTMVRRYIRDASLFSDNPVAGLL
jgi:integrase